MPGLFGRLRLEGGDEERPEAIGAVLSEMAARMRHTGDEAVETWTDRARGLAIARIGPAHLRAIPWPSRVVDGIDRPVAFVDGVLHADAALHTGSLERLGRPALRAMSGFFSAALWEPAARRLTLAADRRASRPIVWTVIRGALWFAPEPKALLAVPGLDRTPDPAAIGVFLGSGYVLADQTLFASIRRLAGGELLVADRGSCSVEPWWRYEVRDRGDGTRPADLERELEAIVRAATARNLAGAGSTVVFLSGGVDSRALAAAAQRASDEPLSTVTWGRDDASPGSDVAIARRVSRALGTRHRILGRSIEGYGEAFTRVHYMLDGLTDVAAYHPHEYTLMRDLAQEGARRVIRGDECFGWLGHVASIEEARLTLNLRKLGGLSRFRRLIRPAAYEAWSRASADALDAIERPLRGEHPDDAKDLLYFRHRLQGYLGPAAYFKQVLLDHRAPLLDEAVLDFNARVPARLRLEKQLFCRAAALGAPDVFRIPLATHGTLEDWDELIAQPSPVRLAVERALADGESGFWELVDRDALSAALPSIGRPSQRAPAAVLARRAKSVARSALSIAPSLRRRLSVRSTRAGIRLDQVILRLVSLKVWHDLFVTGDGGRAALEQQIG